MLHRLHDYSRLTIHAPDGELGTVTDSLFDDARWTIRYLVVRAEMFGRKIAVSPLAITETHWPARKMTSRLSLQQMRNGRDLLATPRMPRTREQEHASYHGYPAHWGGPALWAWAGAPGALAGPPPDEYIVAAHAPASSRVDPRQFELRSLAELRGVHLHAVNGGIGHVDDVMIDHENWHVPYLLIDTSNWIGGRARLVPAAKVTAVDWTARNVYLDLTREQIKESPAFDIDKPLDRTAQEKLAAYYDRPVAPRVPTVR
jgi:hypothetical protein